MTTWHKRDWEQFYELARRPWRRHRPPRPVYPTGLNRVLPAQGFSLSELDDAGVDLDLAESLGLPVDAGRVGAYGPNVTVLRDFIRSSRQPLYSSSSRKSKFTEGLCLCGTQEARKIGVSRELHGHTVPYHLQFAGAAGAAAGCAPAARLVARQVSRRRAVPGPEAHHAHARPPYSLRERALPQHGRVLGTWHRDLHDSGGHLHTRLWVLRRAFGQTIRPAG